jgi:hypothetical protein
MMRPCFRRFAFRHRRPRRLWMCGAVAAPGRNGTSCLLHDGGTIHGDSGSGADAGAARGSPASNGGVGQQPGSCPGTGQCCNGGAAGSFYCYDGDGGCPMVG